MSISKTILVLGALSALSACTPARYPLVTMPSVSMTVRNIGDSPGEELGEVEGQYCQGDDPITADVSNIGMMDEAIMRAQQQKDADFIAGARFFVQDDCVVVSGTAMRVVSGGGGDEADAPEEDAGDSEGDS